MIIFKDRIEITEFKHFILSQPGKLFLRLAGINISNKTVEPVYRPVVTFETIGDYIVLGFPRRKKSMTVVLSFHWPMINIIVDKEEFDD